MLYSHRIQLKVVFLTLAVGLSSVCFGQGGAPQPLDAKTSHGTSVDSPIEERTYDFSEAIAAYAKDTGLSLDEATDQALVQLFARSENVPPPVRREKIGPAKFRVWATPLFHESQPAIVEWMKNGQKQICIETVFITVTEATREDLHLQFGGQWQMSVCHESDDVATSGTSPDEKPTRTSNDSRRASFVTSTSSTIKSSPSRVVQLTAEQAKAFVEAQQADSRANLLQSPKVTLFPGQEATIKDTVQRPFVTGVKPIKGDIATAMQPVIEILEEGLTIEVSASLSGEDKLDINSVIVSRQIGDIESFTFTFDKSSGPTTVQVPEQQVNMVRLSRVIDDGATLLVDPHFVSEETVRKSWGRSATTRRYTMLMFTPRIIHPENKQIVTQPSAATISSADY